MDNHQQILAILALVVFTLLANQTLLTPEQAALDYCNNYASLWRELHAL